MSRLIEIPRFSDLRGSLYVIERKLDFNVKRVYFIKDVDNSTRGKHRHKITKQALIAVNGSCEVKIQANAVDPIKSIILSSPCTMLYLDPEDYHWMLNFSKDCVLLVLASEYYMKDDYIFQAYTDNINY